MRKYSAIFALILTLWGTFSPLGISIVTNTAHRTNTEQKSVAVKIETQKAFAIDPAPVDTPSDSGSNDNSAEAKNKLDCFYTDIFCGVFKVIITFILFIPNGIAAIAGLLMDFSLYISINPGVYGVGGNAVETGLREAWSMIRDFSNIGFIFALFVIAFSLILNKDLLNFNPKKGIIRVIIMALLVNFSFLMCRFIIQGADIFSHLLYSKIEYEEPKTVAGLGGLSASNLLSAVGAKTPSLLIMSHVGPQQAFISSGTVVEKTLGGALTETVATTSNPLDLALIVPRAIMNYNGKGWDFYITYGLMAMVSFFIYLILIFTFASVTFIFLGRIFGLWLGIIVSPLAFVSHAIPMLEDNKFIGFNNWLKSFIELAFVTPIFIFFMYLTVAIFNMDSIIPVSLSSNGLISVLLRQLIPAIGATFLLLKGKKIATDMAGEIGVMAGKMSGALTGLALGAATGGTAMLARQSLGRVGAGVANKFAGDSSLLGRGMRTMGGKLGAATFDVRNNETLMKGFGKFTGAAGEPVDLGKRGMREGGFAAEGTIPEQWRKRQEEAAKRAEEAAIAAAEAAKLNAQAAVAQELRLNESKLELAEKAKQAEDARIAMEAENQGRDVFMELKRMELEEKEGELAELLADATRLSDEHDTLETEKTTLETEKTNLETEKTTLETEKTNLETEKTTLETQLAAIPTGTGSVADREERARLTAEIAAKETEITAKTTEVATKATAIAAKETEITAKTTALATNVAAMTKKEEEVEKKEEDVAKVAAVATTLTTLDVQSVRDARQKKVDLELEATHSLEKEEMDQWKATMEEKNTKRGEEQKKLNALKTKLKNATTDAKKAEIQAEIDEVQKDVDKKDKEYTDAKKTHKAAKKAYDDAFGNKIKALEDFEKDTIENYQNSSDVIARKTTARNAVIDAQKAVNASKNNLDNIDYEFQQKYADDLEINNPQGGWRGTVGTLTGGAMFGGSVRNASENGATKVRQNITGNTGGKK